MTTSSTTTALGVFDDQESAAKAITALKNAGFTDSEIGIATSEWSKEFERIDIKEQKVAEKGAVAGAALGASLGAAFGLVGAIVIPGAIPVLAGGALVSALLGGAAGAAGGAYAGPFIAMGLSDEDAAEQARHINHGKTVLLVHAPERVSEARNIMIRAGAYDEAMA